MPAELLMDGADAYTSLAEVAEVDAPEIVLDIITWSICTLTLQGHC
ncbi:LxmA leader domain family RiPP [Herbidospora mongoliensis]|nr:LxmA leader domain family RiPP [Herbidospora mongoliensis]